MGNGTITMTGAEYDALAGKIATLEAENAKLRAELERRAVDGWKLVPTEMTHEMYLAFSDARGVAGTTYRSGWRAALAAAPSAPATVPSVNQQLLEALTDSLELMETLCAFEDDTIRKARAAIAAARKGEVE